MTGLKQADGNWVSRDRFWNREADLALFIQRIEGGAHQLLVSQRRMGKTSLMQEAKHRLEPEAKYHCLFVDFQKCTNAPDAIVELSLATQPIASLWSRTKGVFSHAFEKLVAAVEKVDLGDVGFTLRAGLTAGNWSDKGDNLFAILASADKPVVLLFDEVPILVNRILKNEDYVITPERRALADEFLSWLRDNSIRHQGKVRITVSGSIGLEPILRQARLSATMNNFQPLELKPWDEETAVGCLEALAREYGVEFRDDAPVLMVRRLGCCIPHHVQMFFAHADAWCKRRGNTEFTAGDVEDVYKAEMLSTRGHIELTHYEERLKLVLGDEMYPLALDMLTEAAVTGLLNANSLKAFEKEYSFEDRPLAEVQKEILWVLEHDGYLKTTPRGYVFVSTLLRDWWKNRHGMFFVPVSERGN